MGMIHHHCVIATSCLHEPIEKLKGWCRVYCGNVLISPAAMNGYVSFVLPTDGSKEGWADSDVGDELRTLFIQRLEKDKYEDGSSPWAYVEVGYGELGQVIVRGNNTNRY